jgi:hypothetical protein
MDFRKVTFDTINAIDQLVALYDIHGRKREVLFFFFVPNTTRDFLFITDKIHHISWFGLKTYQTDG